MASTTSASAASSRTGTQDWLLPNSSGWSAGSRPLALIVRAVGASSAAARARASAAASTQPPPSSSSGFFALRRRAAASRKGARAGAGRLATVRGRRARCSAGAVMTSSGSSMCTGRGRSLSNTAKARASTAGSSSALIRVWLKAQTLPTRLRWFGSSCR